MQSRHPIASLSHPRPMQPKQIRKPRELPPGRGRISDKKTTTLAFPFFSFLLPRVSEERRKKKRRAYENNPPPRRKMEKTGEKVLVAFDDLSSREKKGTEAFLLPRTPCEIRNHRDNILLVLVHNR